MVRGGWCEQTTLALSYWQMDGDSERWEGSLGSHGSQCRSWARAKVTGLLAMLLALDSKTQCVFPSWESCTPRGKRQTYTPHDTSLREKARSKFPLKRVCYSSILLFLNCVVRIKMKLFRTTNFPKAQPTSPNHSIQNRNVRPPPSRFFVSGTCRERPGMGAQACNRNTQEMEIGGLWTEAILGYKVRPH